jgi:hypothetical protein
MPATTDGSMQIAIHTDDKDYRRGVIGATLIRTELSVHGELITLASDTVSTSRSIRQCLYRKIANAPSVVRKLNFISTTAIRQVWFEDFFVCGVMEV